MDKKVPASVFVTGTDTGIGKTWASLAIMEACKNQGMSVAGMKPVASGCKNHKSVLTNDDALAIQQHSSTQIPYNSVNPYALLPPIAPHIAAARASVNIQSSVIVAEYEKLAGSHDCIVVEGIGGWRVPFSEQYQTADLARVLGLPVVLVVGFRLGCINHALLSYECICNDGISMAGWIANCMDPDYGETDETLQYLSNIITAPLLAVFPHQAQQDIKKLAVRINVASLSG